MPLIGSLSMPIANIRYYGAHSLLAQNRASGCRIRGRLYGGRCVHPNRYLLVKVAFAGSAESLADGDYGAGVVVVEVVIEADERFWS